MMLLLDAVQGTGGWLHIVGGFFPMEDVPEAFYVNGVYPITDPPNYPRVFA